MSLTATPELVPGDAGPLAANTQRMLVDLAGVLQLTITVIHTVASYMLAALPFGGNERVHKVRFYGRILTSVFAKLPASVAANAESLQRWLTAPDHFFLAIAGQQAALTAVPLALTLALIAAPRIDPLLPRRILRWALAFAGVAVFAAPYITADFWLSLAWGRSLAQGYNPYYELAANTVADLPHPDPMLATYGPLWLANIGFLARLTEGALWTVIPLKLQLFGAYVVLLWVVARLLAERSPRQQVLGMLCLGWLPLGFLQLVGEGHNDVVMCAMVMIWLYLLRQGRVYAAAAVLACATLVKFAAVVLFLAHVLHALPRSRDEVRAWATRCLGSAAVALALAVVWLAPFYRDVHMADSLSKAQSYEFYLPRDLYFWLVIHTYAPPYAHLGARAVDYALIPVALFAIGRHVRQPSDDTFLGVALALMTALLICFGGHVWPWYLMWLLPLAVLKRRGFLANGVVGLVVAAPFPILVWNALPHLPDNLRLHAPSAVMYAFAIAWAVLVPPYVRVFAQRNASAAAAHAPVGARRRKSTT